MNNIKVEYIYNSGFTIETENKFLVIDYYKGRLDIPEDKDLIFLVTHHHYDHYNKKIFDYSDRANYILSFDINDIEERDNIYFIDVDEKLEVDGIKILALGSTDEGSSFYIELDGWKIFHAGDLNWWAWEDQGEEKERERERNFKKEVDKLKGYDLDIVFGPVDPRLEKNYYLGGKYMIDELEPDYFFQMHFKDDYSKIDKFIEMMRDRATKVFKLDKKNQSFELEK